MPLPLAVPDFVYARYHSREIDRGANPYSLNPPPAALVGVALYTREAIGALPRVG